MKGFNPGGVGLHRLPGNHNALGSVAASVRETGPLDMPRALSADARLAFQAAVAGRPYAHRFFEGGAEGVCAARCQLELQNLTINLTMKILFDHEDSGFSIFNRFVNF